MRRRGSGWAWLAASLVVACGDDGTVPATTTSSSSSGGAGGTSTTSTTSTGPEPACQNIDLPDTFVVDGIVIDQDGLAVADAIVLQGGRSDEPTILSGADGSFSLGMSYAGQGKPAAVATKLGYRSAGVEICALPEAPIELMLYAANPPDHEGFAWGTPDAGDHRSCMHCHELFTQQWKTSKHRDATKSPLVQDLYAGVSRAHNDQPSCEAAGGTWQIGRVPGTTSDGLSKCYLGGGVLPDLNASCGGAAQPACDDPNILANAAPTAFGACADCHTPGMDGKAGGRNLHDAVGLAFEEGVHCDPCHKVKDVNPNAAPGVAGRLVMQRPSEWVDFIGGTQRPLMYGPLLDVPTSYMGGSYQPKYAESGYCAGCHEQLQAALIVGTALDATRWPNGLPTQSTYSEWQASGFPSTIGCQQCHMPETLSIVSSADLATAESSSIIAGFTRPPSQIRAHTFQGPLDGNPRFIDQAVAASLALNATSTTLQVDVTISNGGAAHAIPTGEPMRALVLLVDAVCNNLPLAPSGGMTVPDVGGAHARGTVGVEASFAGNTLVWSEGSAVASPGQRVRVVRPSGSYDDYAGIGLFASPSLPANQKGMEIHVPVGSATITAVGAGSLTLDTSLGVQADDVVYLGDAALSLVDGQPSKPLAGSAGYTFSRVMVDATGKRGVPHYRATDIASDNRLPPSAAATTHHEFALGSCSGSASVSARLLYRPVPFDLALERGYDGVDYLIADVSESVTVN